MHATSTPCAGHSSPAQGSAALDRVHDAPPRYGALITTLAFGFSSAAASRFLGGGLREALVSGVIGLVLASAFPAIVVFAQELVPGRVGMIAGIFFGFAFGMGGIAAAVLGVVADAKGIEFVYWVCSFLPLLGLLTVFLPSMKDMRPPVAA